MPCSGTLIRWVVPPQPARTQAAPTSESKVRCRIWGADVTRREAMGAKVPAALHAGVQRGAPTSVICILPPRQIRGPEKSAERGNQVPGASPVVNPREAQALSAPARQLTPQAHERERAGTTSDSPDPRAGGAGRQLERVRRGRREL